MKVLIKLEKLPLPKFNLEVKNPLPRPSSVGWINPGVWQDLNQGFIYLLFREVALENVQEDKPDIGDLVCLKLDNGYQIQEKKIVWSFEDKDYSLEDIRILPSQNTHLLAGMTVLKHQQETYIPYPGYFILPTPNYFFEPNMVFPKIEVFQNKGPGKNMCPIKENLFVFRSNIDVSKFWLLELQKNKLNALSSFDLNLPNSQRTGLGTPPLFFKKDEGIMIFHNVELRQGISVYNLFLGKIKYSNSLIEISISRKKFLSSADFELKKKAFYKELHSFREVIYIVGWAKIKKGFQELVVLFVNLGDMEIVPIEMRFEELVEFANQM